jgi:hypothetical protein
VSLHVDESMLTGESLPVTKGTDPVPPGAPLGDRTSMAYAGTVVTSGRGRGAVVATGRVAGAALGATSAVTSGGLDALAALSTAGMVTFVDAATEAIVRVPWQEGMTLYAGAEAAQVRTARRAIDLVRAGRLLYSKIEYSDDTARLPVQAGDVVRLVAR